MDVIVLQKSTRDGIHPNRRKSRIIFINSLETGFRSTPVLPVIISNRGHVNHIISWRNRSADNVSNVIYFHLTVNSEGIVSNNHMAIEINYTVFTETVCLRKKPTVGSTLSTIGSNVNAIDMSDEVEVIWLQVHSKIIFKL